MGRKEELEKLMKEAEEIKEQLRPWRGKVMTWREAEKYGWGEKETRLQIRLWTIGYLINKLRWEEKCGREEK